MAKEYITLYQWNDSGVIHQIEVRQQDNGRAVAYVAADTGAATEQARHDIRSAIRLMGWGTLSDHREGKFMLRVTGLRNGEELISMLQAEGFIQGQPQVFEREAVAPKQSFGQWIQANSLKVSGALATIGNALSFTSGIHRGKDWGQIGQGLAFGAADLPMLIAGEKDDARQLNDLLLHLKNHYEKEGIAIPKNASLLVETSNRGKSSGTVAKDYLHRYANQVKCIMEGVAMGFTIWAGRTQDSSFKKYAPFIWGPGFITSLLIPERKIDPEKYAQAGTLQRWGMRIQAHPLAIGGTLGYSNTIATYLSAHQERGKWMADAAGGWAEHGGIAQPKFYKWDYTIPSVMIGANGTYAISHKSAGGAIGEKGIESDVYSIAAQILNKQPEDVRQRAMLSTAEFLGQRTEIRHTKDEILVRLADEMKVQRENPWFEKQGLPEYVPHSLSREAQADLAPEMNVAANDQALHPALAAIHPISTEQVAHLKSTAANDPSTTVSTQGLQLASEHREAAHTIH